MNTQNNQGNFNSGDSVVVNYLPPINQCDAVVIEVLETDVIVILTSGEKKGNKTVVPPHMLQHKGIESYDSATDTLQHIKAVGNFLMQFSTLLLNRAAVHDNSKLTNPEKEFFDKYTPLLKHLTYGSDEYKQSLALLKPALDHHYAANSHHPEHYELGVEGMDLVDVVEMLVDWMAAAQRHNDGDIVKSIAKNKERFNMPKELACIMLNTVARYFPEQLKPQ